MFWNDQFLDKMGEYRALGSKEHDVKLYQTINYVEKALDATTLEDVNNYNLALGLIYKWMRLAIDTRKKDV